MPLIINKPTVFKPRYVIAGGFSANVAAASTVHFDLFNATGSGKIVRVVALYIIPSQTAVAGIGMTWNVFRTNSVGSGGTNNPIVRYDLSDSTVPATITSHLKSTAGNGNAGSIFDTASSSEETTPYASMAQWLNLIPGAMQKDTENPGIVIRENTGICVLQTTNSSIGTTMIEAVITTE